MKRLHLLSVTLLILLSALWLFENCGSSEEEPEPNKAPTCSITNPSNNASAAAGSTVQITVSASDVDGSVSNVKISIDDVATATLSSSPYNYDWNTSGVSPGQHTIKAVATDNENLTANSQITVTITGDAPTVTTADITEITATAATCGGNVTNDGGIDVTARGVVWAESSGPTLESKSGFTEDGTGSGAFTSSIAGLVAGTTYYVKAYATNSQGTSYGEEKNFMTAGLPTVTTGAINNIASNSADCGGEVTDNGGSPITARGLAWSSSSQDFTLDNSEGFSTEGTGTGAFSGSMTSLTRYTDYWVKAYATSDAGTAYGNALKFKTLPEPPIVVTSNITDIEAHIARGGGEVTDDGGDPYVGTGLVWASYQNPEYGVNEGFFLASTNIPFDTLITGLESETTYFVRAWGLNAEGTVVYGEEKSFTTGVFSAAYGSFTDTRDNHVYNTVTISGQTWMAENLALLPEVCGSDAECGYWVYDYQGIDVDVAKATTNYNEYGVLYNWEMAKTSCPNGWHLPSDYEWSYLEVHLGMSITTTIAEGFRGTDQGGKMKETSNAHWDDPNYGGTNSSGFTGLPGGIRDNMNKNFQLMRTGGYFWSSSQEGNWVNYRYLGNSTAQVGSDWLSSALGNTALGGSVRCVKD
jgi:uncharacterized protein (TIGR02145 family)